MFWRSLAICSIPNLFDMSFVRNKKYHLFNLLLTFQLFHIPLIQKQSKRVQISEFFYFKGLLLRHITYTIWQPSGPNHKLPYIYLFIWFSSFFLLNIIVHFYVSWYLEKHKIVIFISASERVSILTFFKNIFYFQSNEFV